MSVSERPEFVTEEHLKYLDALRESGVTNMFGAGQYLDNEFPDLIGEEHVGSHSSAKARKILAYWMETFSERHGVEADRRLI